MCFYMIQWLMRKKRKKKSISNILICGGGRTLHISDRNITVVLLGSVVSDKKIDIRKGLTPHPMQSDV